MGGGVIESVRAPLLNSTLPEETKQAASKALHTDPLNMVITNFSLPAEIAGAMRNAYSAVIVPADRNVKTYGDENVIEKLSVLKILVTTGYERFQQSKIERVGIAHLFDEIIVDALDTPNAIKGKKRIFEEILEKHSLEKEEVLVVGDNPRSELGAAKELGIRAVQTLRPGVKEWAEADAHIRSLSELSALVETS